MLYIVAEGLGGIGARVDAWQGQRGVPTCGEAVWLPMAISLIDAYMVDGLVDVVDGEIRPRLVVVDTFARCMVGGDENSAKDVGIASSRTPSACVGRPGPACSSSTTPARTPRPVLEGPQRCGLPSPPRSSAAMPTASRPSSRRSRRTTKPASRTASTLVPVGDSCALDRYVGASQELSAGALEMLADLAAVADEDGVSAAVWKASTAVAERSFYRWQKQLTERGYCQKTGAKSQARYTLTDLGKQAAST